MFCPCLVGESRSSLVLFSSELFFFDVLGHNHLGLTCKSLYNLPECMSGFDKAAFF